jgi:hypothetical protein
VVLSDGAVLVLTTARVEDRLGRRHGGPMTPDETTTPDATEAAALTWLGRQGCETR